MGTIDGFSLLLGGFVVGASHRVISCLFVYRFEQRYRYRLYVDHFNYRVWGRDVYIVNSGVRYFVLIATWVQQYGRGQCIVFFTVFFRVWG